MKYYIPTSSLNVESILSTETISPISYYSARPFGSKFFQGIQEIKMDSFLYLFSKVPLFSIFDSEVEQYAIALEIDDDLQLKKLDSTVVYEGNDFTILSCCKSIILTPWNCRIIYFDERAYRQSRLAIEASRNSKLGLRFPWVYSDEGILLAEMITKINEDMPGDGPDDLAFNVNKGAIWGFALGCSRSFSEKAAKLVSLANRMRNIASNAISNSGECGLAFYTELKDLDKAYRDIADKEANEKWDQACSSDERGILAKFEVLKEAFYRFLRKNRLTLAPELPYSKDSKEAWVRYRDDLNDYTEALVNKERQALSAVNWNDIVVQDGRISLVGYELINCLLLTIRRGELNKEQIRISRESSMKLVLSEVSAILQKRLGQEAWSQHPAERLYINQLYKNIADFEPFSLNSIDNDELKAIAAFLLKGEDFDALVRYLEDNETANYRLVLCLWGALEGYASIHKTLLSPVLSANNVCRVNSLLGIQEKSLSFPTEVYVPKPYTYGQTRSQRRRSPATPEPDDVKGMVPPINKEPEHTDPLVPKENVDAFEVFFADFVKHCKAAEKDKMIYRRFFIQSFGVTTEFYAAVATDKSLNKGKGAQNNVLKYLEKLMKPSADIKQRIRKDEQQKQSKAESLNLFSHSVIDDDAAVGVVQDLCQGTAIAEKVIANFKDIQNGYREGGYYYKRQDSRKNSDVIDHFCRFCFSDRNRYHRITHSSENDALIKMIGEELRKYYVD